MNEKMNESIKVPRFYKIIDKNTGLFQTSGGNIHFDKKGNIWSSIGALKNHLRLFVKVHRKMSPEEIAFEITKFLKNSVDWLLIEYSSEPPKLYNIKIKGDTIEEIFGDFPLSAAPTFLFEEMKEIV
jgi:hypothetical protein